MTAIVPEVAKRSSTPDLREDCEADVARRTAFLNEEVQRP